MRTTHKIWQKCTMALCIGLAIGNLQAQVTSDFENLPLSENSFWNGSEGLGSFRSGAVDFKNHFNTTYSSWSGFAYSNMGDVTTQGYGNQYSSITGSGVMNSKNFAVAYVSGKNSNMVYQPVAKGCKPKGMYITNSTFTALDMQFGSKFSKKFGGTSGNDPDFLLLNIINYSKGKSNDTIPVYLADYRFSDNTKDYILNAWTYIDLTKFHYSDSIGFQMSSTDSSFGYMNTPSYFCMDNFTVVPAPFAPIAGAPGSTAIAQESTLFTSWATGITVTRGLRDISMPDSGYATYGNPNGALGKAGANGLVSLGDGGTAVLTFDRAIINGSGPDFAVFENSFSDTFLEMAFVEVSSDGEKFVRFPAYSYTDTIAQLNPFGHIDTRMIHNLAGKYRGGFGTPFDLQDLKDSSGVNINAITHVRLVDVIGSLNPKWGTRDANGNLINELWPTNFASSGFDLDAVGVIHESLLAVDNSKAVNAISVYPNPANAGQVVSFSNSDVLSYQMFDALGNQILSDTSSEVTTDNLQKGFYLLKLQTELGVSTAKLTVR